MSHDHYAGDMTGLRIGTVTVLTQRPGADGHGSVCDCRCDCGNTFTRRAQSIRYSARKDLSVHCSLPCPLKRRRTSAIIHPGTRVGHLTVIDKLTHDGAGQWACACDCGATTWRTTTALLKAIRHHSASRCTQACPLRATPPPPSDAAPRGDDIDLMAEYADLITQYRNNTTKETA